MCLGHDWQIRFQLEAGSKVGHGVVVQFLLMLQRWRENLLRGAKRKEFGTFVVSSIDIFAFGPVATMAASSNFKANMIDPNRLLWHVTAASIAKLDGV